jgi:hypothetical protein
MIYLPWIAFLAGILWMIWQGDKAKGEYLRRRKAEEEEKARIMVQEKEIGPALKEYERRQSRTPELAETFGGRGQRGGSVYGSGSGPVS